MKESDSKEIEMLQYSVLLYVRLIEGGEPQRAKVLAEAVRDAQRPFYRPWYPDKTG
jgi:hypothetical protein